MDHWQRIFDYLSLPTTSTLYLGVGACMGHYVEITEQNNQQYPCFLNRFEGSHLVVLIDPCMESDLKLFTYFEQINDPLVLVNQTSWDNTQDTTCVQGFWHDSVRAQYPGHVVPKVREFINGKGKFFIINDCFYPEANRHMNPVQLEKSSESVSIMYQLITIGLGKVSPSKIIYQDYTGFDSTHFYTSLFGIFGREPIISHVCFDVTQNDGGCFFEIKPDMIQLDDFGNFFQEKYELLTKITNSPNYLRILRTRMDNLTYPTVWNFIKMQESYDYEQVFVHRAQWLADIYGLELNFSNRQKLIGQYFALIKTIIQDIVRSRDIDDSFSNYLIANLDNRNEFINTMGILRFE